MSGLRLTVRLSALLVLVVAICGCVAGCGAGSESTVEAKTRAAEEAGKFVVRPVRWGIASVPGAKVVKIGSKAVRCEGYAEPRYRRIEVAERRGGAYITAYVAFPGKGSQPNSNPKDKVPEPCFGTGLLLLRNVHLKRRVEKVRLYDAGSDPPELRRP
jgi:hypothetical protein